MSDDDELRAFGWGTPQQMTAEEVAALWASMVAEIARLRALLREAVSDPSQVMKLGLILGLNWIEAAREATHE